MTVIPNPPTHAEVEADRQARFAEKVRAVESSLAESRAAQISNALATLRDAGYRQQELVLVVEGRRQWRTVLIAPEGGK